MLIDGDGVLYHGNQPVPELRRFFTTLQGRRIQWGLLTNNATRPPEHYVEKMATFGVELEPSAVFTSATVTADYLKQRFPAGGGVYVVGEVGVKSAIAAAGFQVHDGDEVPEGAVAVVAGLDREMTWRRLRVATLLVRYHGAAFVATNPDRTLPTPDGLVPGAGTTVAALMASTDQQPTIIGKPAPAMFEMALRRMGSTPSTTVMLGDRLDTDIAGAAALGLTTILVLSGVSTRSDVEASSLKPDLVFNSLADLAAELEGALA